MRETLTTLLKRWNVRDDENSDASFSLNDGIRLNALRKLCCKVDQAGLSAEQQPLAGLRILVAEDNRTNQIVARKTLMNLGADVVLANNGQEAVEQFSELQFDLVLMDCEMPVRDGYTATSEIRQLERTPGRPNVPIVALSANATTGYKERAFAAGMTDYVAKPFKRDELVDKILRSTRGFGI